MPNRNSEPSEMYLKTIHHLAELAGIAKTGQIATALGVSKGAVTNSLANLERRGLIQRRRYRGVKLTAKGEAIAVRVLRKHRLAERLLTEVLGMSWSEVHDVACRLEHAITEDMTESLHKLLRSPKTCPHGNPIPNHHGRIEEPATEPLTNLKLGREAVIAKIGLEKTDLLRYIASLGLLPGVTVRLEERAPFNGPVIVRIRGARYALGQDVAASIHVRKP